MARLLSRQGALLITLGEFEEAQRSLEISARHEMRREIAIYSLQMGNITRMRGEYDEAKRTLEESIVVSKEVGDLSIRHH